MKADRKQVERLLKTARGQLDGILKMVEEDRYCMEISNQLLATQSILRKVNREIIHAHLESCVAESLGPDSKEKISELMTLFDKLGN
ncbi:metal-sensing transcriptional repressor [Acidaminobacterium chupaoyuni]